MSLFYRTDTYDRHDTVVKPKSRLLMNPRGGDCLPDLLGRQLRVHPERTALVSGDQALSFRALGASSFALATRLRQAGAVPDECVGIFVEPSIALLTSVWGTLLADCAYLPLSPDYPDERIRYMCEHSQVRTVITQESLRERLATLVPRGVRILVASHPGDGVATSASDLTAWESRLAPEHLAYVIYTSGSTGKPKGVMIEQHSIVGQMNWLRDEYGIGEQRVVLQKTPMSFDAAQWEILANACGAKIVMAPPGAYRDPAALIGLIVKHGVTTLQCVPTLLHALLDTDGIERCTSLTQVFSGGEVLTRQLAKRCMETLPWAKLVNLYGPTECTINSSALTVDLHSLARDEHSISIGSPVRGLRYQIFDASMATVAVGETGELYIGGDQLARGYLHRPDLTSERFIVDPTLPGAGQRLYRTGDIARRNSDGTYQFLGRVDSQVKLRGHRVELDEIRVVVETLDWVRRAVVVVKHDPRTDQPFPMAYVELNPRVAALMDQGDHDPHHQSKASRVQVKAQLSGTGLRDEAGIRHRPAFELPGAEPTTEQKSLVFARKTYRFYEGGPTSRADILALLSAPPAQRIAGDNPRLDLARLGSILRYFGQFISDERLLPKYGYASPGALYATQIYVELGAMGELPSGYYYYHPARHQLILIRATASSLAGAVRVHLIGKHSAIQPIYKHNISEVLEIEAGHIVGLFEHVLPRFGLGVERLRYSAEVADELDVTDDDHYLCSIDMGPSGNMMDPVDIYVQVHPGRVEDLPAGQYVYQDGELRRVSDELILRQHVIAINQKVYDRAAIGISMVCPHGPRWRAHIDLGRKLQALQLNEKGFGFMSAGYSSNSGHDLPSANRLNGILRAAGRECGASYFAVGGRISEAQRQSVGMKEDAVHMKGPAEMIKDDLVPLLPDYMVPRRVVVLDKIPLMANGKTDLIALQTREDAAVAAPVVAPRTEDEVRIHKIWCEALKQDDISVTENFFDSGGDSIVAVMLIHRLNQAFATALPVQVIFEASTIEALALAVRRHRTAAEPPSRLVTLAIGAGRPIFCWPGLGGYPMNLRSLAEQIDVGRPIVGVQAHGINPGERRYAAIADLVEADLAMIRRRQPRGPYTLLGYSIGARVAFEVACRLERSGDLVDHLFLIAPGTPDLSALDGCIDGCSPSFTCKAHTAIIFSVFATTVDHPSLRECLATVTDEETFTAFVRRHFANLDSGLVARVTQVATQTRDLVASADGIASRRLAARTVVWRAPGDEPSFVEATGQASCLEARYLDLSCDHYAILQQPGVSALAKQLCEILRGR